MLVALIFGLLLIYPALVLRRYIRIMINILDDCAPIPENGGNEIGRASCRERV